MKNKPSSAARLVRAVLLLLLLPLMVRPLEAACRVPQWSPVSSGYFSFNNSDFVVADMNGDRHLDIVGLGSWGFQTALGNGAASFTSIHSVFEDDANAIFSDVNVGDFTGDGRPDVAIADYGLGRILVYPGTASADYLPPVITALPRLPKQISANDFNEDGHLDLLYATWESNTVYVLTGDGTGHFTESGEQTLPAAQITRILTGDFDGDGHIDLAFAHKLSSAVDVVYGTGLGTFIGATQALAGRDPESAVAMYDIDGDGDADLVAANWIDQTVTVAANLGGRTFGATRAWTVRGDDRAATSGYQDELAIADFNGDGHVDVVTTSLDGYYVKFAILNGHGDGTFDDVTFSRVSTQPYGAFVSGDFDEDGRIDLVSPRSSLAILVQKNVCGDTSVAAVTTYPLINVQQSATVTATVTPADYFGSTDSFRPSPTGTIEFLDGSTVVGSKEVSGNKAALDISGLTAGDHIITLRYSGDENYAPRTGSCLQRVTAAYTTTTLTFPQSPEYGQNLSVGSKVTSSSGDTVGGKITVWVDGQSIGTKDAWVPYEQTWYVAVTDIGVQHTFKATYSGDSTHPPSATERTFVSAKASGGVSLSQLYSHSLLGTQLEIGVGVGVNNTAAQPPTGTVRVFVDGAMVTEVPADNAYPFPLFTISLPLGVHYFSADYAGDDHFTAGHLTPQTISHTVAAATGLSFEARAEPTGTVTLMTTGRITYSRITKRTAGSISWSSISGYNDDPIQRGVMYLYRLEVLDWTGKVTDTLYDVAMVPDFLEWPILPGITVKADHFREIVARTNLMRAIAGLAPVAAPATVSAGQPIMAADVQQIRALLDEARHAVGCTTPNYSRPALSAGVTIRASDMAEMQEATR